MAVLKGSDRTLQYIKEVTVGVTPTITAGDMKVLPNTGDTFNFTRDTFVSNEITGNRGVTDLNYGNKQSAGNLNFELSYGNFDEFLEAVIQSDDSFGVLEAPVKDSDNLQGFTIQRGYEGATSFYERFTGMCPDTLDLQINVNAQVTGSINFIGMNTVESATNLDATPIDYVKNKLFNSYTGSIKEGSGLTSQTKVSSLALTINNGLSALFGLFSDSSFEVTSGKCNITGTMTMYFEDKTIAEKYISGIESELEFELHSNIAKTEGYKFRLPRIKYTGADKPVSGEGAIMLTLPFQSLYDDTEECTIAITKLIA